MTKAIKEDSLLVLSPMEARDLLVHLMNADIPTPVMLHGPPGVGKTSIVYQAAALAGRSQISDVRLSQLSPLDIRGLPITKEQVFDTIFRGKKSVLSDIVTTSAVPGMFPRNEGGLLFLDELTNAVPAIMALIQQILLEGRMGDAYTVPERTFMIAAGNRKQDRAATFSITQPVNNRMYHIEIKTSVDDFARYALETGKVHEHIVAFLRARPNLLFKFDEYASTWPSPRMWEKASDLYRANVPTRQLQMAVGIGPAREFSKFVTIIGKLPRIEGIMNGTEQHFKFPPENEPDQQWAMVTALANQISTTEHLRNAVHWIDYTNREWIRILLTDFKVRPPTDSFKPAKIMMGLRDDPRTQQLVREIVSSFSNVR